MRKIWFDEAWEDYLYWQTQDKKTLKRVNLLIKDIERGSFEGKGKPEPLKGKTGSIFSTLFFAVQGTFSPPHASKECKQLFMNDRNR